jgi:hypothetical protein
VPSNLCNHLNWGDCDSRQFSVLHEWTVWLKLLNLCLDLSCLSQASKSLLMQW